MIEKATKQQIEVVQMPTTADINALRIKRFKQRVTDTIETQDLSEFSALIASYAEETGEPFENIAAALAHIGQQGRPFLAKDRPKRERRGTKQPKQYDRPSGNRKPRKMGPPAAGMERFRINVGRTHGAQPRNIVGAVANEAGLDGSSIGPIQIYDTYTLLDLPAEMPGDVYRSLGRTRILGKALRLSLASKADENSDSHNRHKDQSRGKSRKARAGGPQVTAGKKGKKRKAKSAGKRKNSNPSTTQTAM